MQTQGDPMVSFLKCKCKHMPACGQVFDSLLQRDVWY